MNSPRLRQLLVVTYEFPPTGGGGVQRISRFCRDLRELGWEPTVVTAEHIKGRPIDEALAEGLEDIRVIRLPHRNVIHAVARPLAVVKGLRAEDAAGDADATGSGVGAQRTTVSPTPTRKAPLSTRIARWISSPDEASRWAASVPAAASALGIEFDAVLASGPPHSALVAGEKCARQMGIPLIADVRDAWSTNPNMRYATSAHRSAARRHQERVCETASLVVAVSPPIAEEARKLGADETLVIPNGFDRAEMPALDPDSDAPLTLGFMGRFYALTDPAPLLDAMASLLAEGRDVRFEIVGAVEQHTRDAVTARGLADSVTFHGYLPHDRALQTIARCDMGAVIIAEHPGSESVYTGKLFEYLGMGIPVLVVGPAKGVAATLVRESGAGLTASYPSPEAVADVLGECARKKSLGEPLSTATPESFVQFERSQQARELSERLQAIVGETA